MERGAGTMSVGIRYIVGSVRAFIDMVAARMFAATAARPNVSIIEYPGMCDPSAAAAINNNLFIVASDEDNILRVYARGAVGAPQRFDLNSFLRPDGEHPEADLEGATRLGDFIYWIGSHGRNRNGKLRPSRHRLFATSVRVEVDKVAVVPIGVPYTRLLEDLAQAPALRTYDLEGASRKAPESEGGLNIEGLAATPQDTLMIAFRNPIPGGKALIVPLENPQQVIEGQQAKLGPPIELSLNGLGIRSIEYREGRGRYLIVAGPHDDDGETALFSWSGSAFDAAEPVPAATFGDLNPEALFVYPGDGTAVQFLSDDGGRTLDGVACKDLPPARRRFRAFSMGIP